MMGVNTVSTANQIYQKEYKDKMESMFSRQDNLKTLTMSAEQRCVSAQTGESDELGLITILEGDFA
jgi:hypothetical protein